MLKKQKPGSLELEHQRIVVILNERTNGKPAWKVSGKWKFTNLSSKSLAFNASFDMMKLDGSSKHKHTIDATIISADFSRAGKSSLLDDMMASKIIYSLAGESRGYCLGYKFRIKDLRNCLLFCFGV
jgi:hypothetical protein